MSTLVKYCFIVIVTVISYAEAGTPQYTLLDGAQHGYLTVAENQTVNTTLFKVHATDSDPGDVLQLVPENDLAREYVKAEAPSTGNNVTFDIKLIKKLDYEKISIVKIYLVLMDKTQNTIHIGVTLYLTDVNDNPPVFTKQPYTWEIHEQPCNASGPWNTFIEIHASDKDSGKNGRVTYSMEPKSEYEETKTLYNSKFQIDPSNGHVTQKECVDYETNSYYQFSVMAKDGGPNGGLNTSVDFIIRVKDDQDTPPFFTRDSFRKTIPEDTLKGEIIATVHAIDGDRGVSQQVEYTAVSDCGDFFTVDVSTGDIRTTTVLDRDGGIIFNNSGECVINIMATEIETNTNQYNTTKTNTTVTITISDVNDNSPTFTEGSNVAAVKENTPSEVPVMFNKTLHVSDIDQDKNADMDISVRCLNNTTGCSTFKVSPTTIHGSGDIIVQVSNETMLDYEKRKHINITVIATERANKSHVASFDVDVKISDVNDNGPKFNTTSISLDIDENSANGTSVGTITATDSDISPKFKNLTYSIVGGNGKFKVNENTGEIYTVCDNCDKEFDREIQDTYFMTYTATDIGGRRDSMSIEVHLLDKNDNAPQFSRKTYLVYKQENDEIREVVKVEASDDDKMNTNNSKFNFEVCNSTDTYFDTNNLLHMAGDWLNLSSPIDYEALSDQSKENGIVNITIKVKDEGTPILSSFAMVQLTIQDVNDNGPNFNETQYNYSLLENSTTKSINNATEVGQVSANDTDGTTRNSQINYFIQAGGADRFDIGYNSGIVTVRMNARFDRETQQNYTLTILATDQGSPPKSANVSVFIDILDVNDEYPVFTNSAYAISVKENATVSQTIISCQANDPDLNDTLNYSILSASATNENGDGVNETLIQNYFGIDDRTGGIYVASKLDRETAKTVVIKLLVDDTAAFNPKPQNDTVSLTITLLDVNDNAPAFTEMFYNTHIIENAIDGTMLIQTPAHDIDENRTISYRLDNSTDKFDIDPVTGWISKKGELDREKTPYLLFKVIATDNGVPTKSLSVEVNVTIDDFNDNAPEFTTNNTTIDVRENVAIGYHVIDINATDNDIGPNANVTFTLQDNEHTISYFEIDSNTGVITVKNTLDRETINRFNLIIIAKDNPVDTNVQKTAQKSIVINIEDVNDNPPEFSQVAYSADIVENVDNSSAVIRVVATDNDTGVNAELRYEIDRKDGLFRIDHLDGTIRVNASLIEKVGVYTLKVMAFDKGTPAMNGSTTVNITVLDVNLNHPVITHLPEGADHEISVYECVRNGTIIYSFNYTDKDHGLNAEAEFNMSRLSDDVSHLFKLMPNGSLQVIAGKLSVNDASQYKFQIQAIDKGTPRLTSNKETITVTITDVNDHLPSFPFKQMSFTVKENMTKHNDVSQVKAYDKDTNSKPCYSIDPTTPQHFIIEKDTGKIFYNKSIDYEINKTVTFIVRVSDCSMKMNVSDYCDTIDRNEIAKVNEDVNATLEVTVDVLDIDDNPPRFLSKSLSTGMRRNTEPGIVLSLNLRNSSMIYDADTKPNGVFSWRFSNYGNITSSSNLDKIAKEDGTDTCEDGIKHIFCVTQNGTIVNNKYFSEDLIGYFVVSIKVWDNGGSDIANLTIYLIGDSQILSMNIRQDKEEVSGFKEELLTRLSDILGPYTAVFDNLQDHKENDVVDKSSSDIHFHIVRSDTKEVITGDEAVRLLDKATSSTAMLSFKNQYNIMTVGKKQTSNINKDDHSNRTFFILIAVSVSEALIISLVVYVSLATKAKYQRKLKAANIKPDIEMHQVENEIVVVPGSNMYAKQYNPLLNAKLEESHYNEVMPEDSNSVVSDINLDDNDVDDPQTVYDRMEEKEVTLDMYTDDSKNNVSSENLLESALSNYDRVKKSRESLDNIDDYEDINDVGNLNGNVEFRNYAFDEDLEATEI